MKKRRALILYATMTKNTEKVATWFKETFEEYNWDVTFVKLQAPAKMTPLQDQLYFDDYDVIALGSPIVGGMPLQNVIKNMSMGGGGALEKEVQTKLDANKDGNNAHLPHHRAVHLLRHAGCYPDVHPVPRPVRCIIEMK